MYKSIFSFIIITYICCWNLFKTTNKHLTQNNDKILWSNERKLKENDFEALPDTTNLMIAGSTYSGIEITNSYFENDIPKFVVECNFIKSKSWIRIKSKDVLDHEQLHFDIDELFTRKIRKAFDSLNVKKVKDYQIYNNIYIFYGEKCETYQKLYDNQVYFNDSQQQQWIKKVGAELLRLKKYEYIPEE